MKMYFLIDSQKISPATNLECPALLLELHDLLPGVAVQPLVQLPHAQVHQLQQVDSASDFFAGANA